MTASPDDGLNAKYTPDGVTFRRYGPAARFDHHHPADPPVVDTTGRRILYVGEDLATSACEVFGDAGIAAICPNYRVAIIAPTTKLVSHVCSFVPTCHCDELRSGGGTLRSHGA